MTCRDEVLNAAQILSKQSHFGEFTLGDILKFLERQGTSYKESTIRTHVVSRMCDNAPDNHGVTYADLVRSGYGTYRLNNNRIPSDHTVTGTRNLERSLSTLFNQH